MSYIRLPKPAKPEPAPFFTRQHGILTPQLRGYFHGSSAHDRKLMADYFTRKWDDEDPLQVAALDTLYAITREEFECIHYPAGGHRSKTTAAYLKRIGQRSGVSDLQGLWPWRGLGYVELKSATGPKRFSQKQFVSYIESIGFYAGFAQSIAETVRHFVKAGAPVKPEFMVLGELA